MDNNDSNDYSNDDNNDDYNIDLDDETLPSIKRKVWLYIPFAVILQAIIFWIFNNIQVCIIISLIFSVCVIGFEYGIKPINKVFIDRIIYYGVIVFFISLLTVGLVGKLRNY
jgi:hypothetical protein